MTSTLPLHYQSVLLKISLVSSFIIIIYFTQETLSARQKEQEDLKKENKFNEVKLQKLQQEIDRLQNFIEDREPVAENEIRTISTEPKKDEEPFGLITSEDHQLQETPVNNVMSTAPILKSQQTDTDDLLLLDDRTNDKSDITDIEKLQSDLENAKKINTDTIIKYENEKSVCSDLEDKNRELEEQLLLSSQNANGLETSLKESKLLLAMKDVEIEKLQNASTAEKEEFEKLKKQMILLEEQLMQTRQLKDQYEDKIEWLTSEVENRLRSKEKPFTDGDQKIVSEISLNSVNPLEPSFGEKNDSAFKLEILQQQLEEQHLEMASLETNLKSEICDLQQNAENQERLVFKLEHENKQLIRQSYELNDNILTQQERIEELMNENNHLSALLSLGNKNCNDQNLLLDSISQSQSRIDNDRDFQQLNLEIEALKDKLISQELEKEKNLKSNDCESSWLEKQIESLQSDLDEKAITIRDLTAECQQLRMLKNKEQATSVEQESYLLCEIERVQSEYKQKAHRVEEDKDDQIALLRKEHEEKLLEMEVEFEHCKALELNNVREDYLSQIESLVSQRAELMMALRKLESTKDDDKNYLSDNDDRLMKPTFHRQDGNNMDGDILIMLANLERHMNFKNKQQKTAAVDLNKTWPTAEGSALPTSTTDTMNLRDQIEKARSDISMQIQDLDKFFPISPTTTQHSLNDTSSSFDEIIFDYEDSVHRPNSASSPVQKQTRGDPLLTTPPSVFRDSGIASDFATSLSNSNYQNPVPFYEKQLRDLLHSFRRFELQCRLVGGTDFSSEKWFIDLRTWRERVNTRLRKIEQHYLGGEHDEDSILKSIVFRPSNLEIREIIADVNQKYDRYKTHEF